LSFWARLERRLLPAPLVVLRALLVWLLTWEVPRRLSAALAGR
jgi:hypothetical protein